MRYYRTTRAWIENDICLGLSRKITEEGDGIRVHIVARRRARRRDVTLGKHGRETPLVVQVVVHD